MLCVFLIISSSAQPSCGVDFAEVVGDDDRDRLRGLFVGSVRSGCMHPHLRDSSGARVAVQLLHTRLAALLGQLSHVIGIREETEGQLARHPPDSLNCAATVRQRQVSTGNAEIVSAKLGSHRLLGVFVHRGRGLL